jgi:cysteine rich repeat protein
MDGGLISYRSYRAPLEARVRRFYFAIAMFVFLAAPSASGQYVEVVSACSRNATEFCNPAHSQRNQLAQCIEVHFEEFSEPCKVALVKVSAVREACKADIQEQCHHVKPSAGRVLLCVKGHFAALSMPCKDAIGRAAERKIRVH